jgi:tetratricopeptide (TPR) repeat protein
MKTSRVLIVALLAVTTINSYGQKATTSRTVTIVSEPNAVVWIDEIRRGATDLQGRLADLKISAGAHSLRVRAAGFKQASISLAATQRGEVRVNLVRATDQAELVFQQAETARETARDDAARQSAAELYRQSLKLRPSDAAAHVGLARVLLDLNDTNGALEEIEAALGTVPEVKECAVVYRKLGEGLGEIVGFAALATAKPAAELIQTVARVVPPYMVPKRVILLSDLPKNANGKIDRVVLQSMASPAA